VHPGRLRRGPELHDLWRHLRRHCRLPLRVLEAWNPRSQRGKGAATDGRKHEGPFCGCGGFKISVLTVAATRWYPLEATSHQD